MITCDTESVIYKVTCQKCADCVYIGETERKAVDRFGEHKEYVVNLKLDQSSAEQFNLKGHYFSEMSPCVLKKSTEMPFLGREERIIGFVYMILNTMEVTNSSFMIN